MKHRRMKLVGLVLSFALLAVPAFAHPEDGHGRIVTTADDGSPATWDAKEQHGPADGHLPATQENVELVGKVAITGAAPGRVADVTAFGTYAYLAVRDPEGCFDAGMAIIDIANPAQPRQVGFIEATDGSFPGEGAQVLDMKTKSFRGQVLVSNNELCAVGGEGGVSLWDVTNPLQPTVLAAHAGDNDPGGAFSEFNQIHSAFAWQDGKRAFVVIVVNEETTDVDILEITDPRHPVLLTELDLNDFGVLQQNTNGQNAFLHDMVVKKVRGTWTMLLSYWDGGWVLLNVNDPANPRFIKDSTYPDPDTLTDVSPPEGNAHQAEWSNNDRLILGTDEDFAPYRLTGTNTTDNRTFSATQGSDTPQIDADTSLTGQTTFVGRACNGDPAVPAGDGSQVAVVERGVCAFTEKVANIEAAGGYVGVILMNREGPDGCTALLNPTVEGDVPVAFVGRDTGYAFFNTPYNDAACLAGDGTAQAPIAIGTLGDAVNLLALFDGWGYVRLLDARTLEQIDAYAIDEALDPAYASGYGALSVHEVATDPNRDLAYLSYYAGGLRVIAFGRNGLEEVGRYIAPGGNDFWGVEAHRLPKGTPRYGKETLILASDRDSGLWIFRYTGK